MNSGRSAGMQRETSTGLDSRTGRSNINSGGISREDETTLAWRRDEHGRFMQALEMFGSRKTGDEWKHITAFVGSRTMEEVRLHGRQYLQELVQQSPQPSAATPSRYFSFSGNQNDPNRQNYQLPNRIVGLPQDGKGKRRAGGPHTEASALSAAASEIAQALTPIPFHKQLQSHQQQRTGAPAPRRRPEVWTFEEDKIFETVLAGWVPSEPYSWTKIAEALPGKTATDVRNRYEKLVDDISSIETGKISVAGTSTSGIDAFRPVKRGAAVPPQTSTLSQRAIPPPPIEVPPRSIAKDGAPGAFPSSTRSRRGSITGGISMLSPTFLDMLANEAENEEKSPLPSLPLPFPSMSNLPSPLFSPSLLPSGSPAFFSPDKKSEGIRAQHNKGKKLSVGPDDVEETDATSQNVDKNDDPQRSSTPRISSDFLEFKFDVSLGTTPTQHRRAPRSKPIGSLSAGPLTKAPESGKGQLDGEIPDASAA